jgi:thiamine biosynthesis lipoprotein ApbE
MLFGLLALLFTTPSEPVRITASSFGQPVEIEVRDLSREAGQEAIRKALAEMAEIERLTDPNRGDGALAILNAAAGKGPQPLDSRLMALLTRVRDFCFWSEQALGRAACGLALDSKGNTATLAAGGSLDLHGFAEGYAADRAVESLRGEGVTNGFVRVGEVHRGFGGGPGGKGWPVVVPAPAGMTEPVAGRVFLRDRSLAVATRTQPRPYVNQRNGKPAEGALTVAASSELAVDAQALAATLLILGPREGQMRLGSLKPKPSALWFLGSGTGQPLQTEYRWSEIPKK